MAKFDPEVIGATREIKDLKKEILAEKQKINRPRKRTPKKEKKKVKLMTFLFVCSVFLLITLIPLYMMALNKSILISFPVVMTLLVLFLLLLVLSGIYLFLKIDFKKKKAFTRKGKVLLFLLLGYFLLITSGTYLLYGNHMVKDFIINKALASMKYQPIASFFYDDKTINEVASTRILEEEQNTLYEDIVSFDDLKLNQPSYANQYEEAILSNPNHDSYKILKIEGVVENTTYHYQGYMAVVYDPSKVKLATSSGMGMDDTAYGEIIPVMAEREKAIIAMNAGGFYDPDWRSNGGIPHGPVIKDGVLLTNFRKYPANGGIIGFNYDNQLVLKNITGEEAVLEGIRDAVDWGPYLIINGINQIKKQTSTYALARTAIGQRKDGIVLMLVIDGLQSHSKGCTFYEMAKIMEQYGAYNAANLDGGTSASLYEKGQFLNNPFNGERRTIRRLPNAWIVVE